MMKITGERKAAAARLAELTGERAVYTRMPRCAYEIGSFAIERDGSITPDLIGSDFSDGKVNFTGFPFTEDADRVKAFTQLAAQMNKLAKEQKRTMAKTVDITNERYIFRIWLLALGMGGDEFKTARWVLLHPLSGSAAFKDQAMEDRWKAKQAAKRDAAKEVTKRDTLVTEEEETA